MFGSHLVALLMMMMWGESRHDDHVNVTVRVGGGNTSVAQPPTIFSIFVLIISTMFISRRTPQDQSRLSRSSNIWARRQGLMSEISGDLSSSSIAWRRLPICFLDLCPYL